MFVYYIKGEVVCQMNELLTKERDGEGWCCECSTIPD